MTWNDINIKNVVNATTNLQRCESFGRYTAKDPSQIGPLVKYKGNARDYRIICLHLLKTHKFKAIYKCEISGDEIVRITYVTS